METIGSGPAIGSGGVIPVAIIVTHRDRMRRLAKLPTRSPEPAGPPAASAPL